MTVNSQGASQVEIERLQDENERLQLLDVADKGILLDRLVVLEGEKAALQARIDELEKKLRHVEANSMIKSKGGDRMSKFIHTKPRYSINDLLKLLSMGRSLLYKDISNGKLDTYKIAGRRFASPEALDRYITVTEGEARGWPQTQQNKHRGIE